jgi:hypothetical protein
MGLSFPDVESEPIVLHVPSTNEKQEYRNYSAYIGLVTSGYAFLS